jgi:hypothetical protein
MATGEGRRRGFELAISTLVLIIVGLLVLVGLIVLSRRGFDVLDRTREPVAASSEIVAIAAACNGFCAQANSALFCCRNFTLGGAIVRCVDEVTGATCAGIDCLSVTC